MERRLSIALAGAGLLAALGFFAGRTAGYAARGDIGRPPPISMRLIRETAAGVQARADTLAQLPRLGWAVATDEDTMRDLTTEELAFRPRPANTSRSRMRQGGGGPPPAAPAAGARARCRCPRNAAVPRRGKRHVVRSSASSRASAPKSWSASSRFQAAGPGAIEQRLAARGNDAELRLREGSFAFGAPTPAANGTLAKTTLTSPSASGVELSVVWPGGRPVWTKAVPVAIALLSLLGAALLWRRKTEQEHVAPADAPTTIASPPQVIDPQASTGIDFAVARGPDRRRMDRP